MFLLDLLLGNVVRNGDEVTVYGASIVRVGRAKVYGWGKYAPVYVAGTIIRRDGIVKVANGKWEYTLEGE